VRREPPHHTQQVGDPPVTDCPTMPCRVCGRQIRRPTPVCFCCRVVARQLGLPLVPTVAAADYRLGDAGHLRLRGYKDAPTARLRALHRGVIARTLDDWLDHNTAALVDRFGAWSVVAPVPSTRRAGPPPAGALLDEVPTLAGVHLDLLSRGSGTADHLAACRNGFALLPGVDRAGLDGLPVLVFDDSVTTGARSQSAAATLRLGGAHVVGVLAVGRALPAA